MRDPETVESQGLPDVQEKAAKEFGVTNNPYEAGFILCDGSMLKRPRGTVFHNYVEGEGHKPGDYAYKFLESGAIRFSRQKAKQNDIVTAEFTIKPTNSQILTLKSVSVGVDILAIDFTDVSTKRPVVFEGYPMALQISVPSAGRIDDFFRKVKKVAE